MRLKKPSSLAGWKKRNQNARYRPWYACGFLQLTWPQIYVKYARFVGKIEYGIHVVAVTNTSCCALVEH